ncbi:hypothetical protein WJX73_010200 [Symbiochloris irregularis]|uniref:Plasmid pRiA4b Orf3-like domain-containing protein n=1 Tax=Symbiochloris irregularis TaxID=706552 RepID=A0AAW1PF72_9CHLO
MPSVCLHRQGTRAYDRLLERGGLEMYELDIELEDTDPVVWRRIVIAGGFPARILHFAINCVMGWDDIQNHEFTECTDGENAGPPENCGGTDGFRAFKQVMANPQHPDNHCQRAWYL